MVELEVTPGLEYMILRASDKPPALPHLTCVLPVLLGSTIVNAALDTELTVPRPNAMQTKIKDLLKDLFMLIFHPT